MRAGRSWLLGALVLASCDAGRVDLVVELRTALVPFDGALGGELRLEAADIEIAGTIDATGRGAAGGDGGRGQRSNKPYCGGDGEAGEVGGGPFGGAAGGAGRGHGGDHSDDSGCRYADGGDAAPGGAGGYAAPGANGDASGDDEVWIGSGGGGGGGGGAGSRYGSNNNYPAGTGGGGGAGGRGGGSLRLEARGALRVTGAIVARGTADGGDGAGGGGTSGCERYQDPAGGAGGDSSATGAGARGPGRCNDLSSCGDGTARTCGGDGGAGGAGAGGGVLLRALDVELGSGVVDLRGGRDESNGGTLKVRYTCVLTEGELAVGRYDPRPVGGCE